MLSLDKENASTTSSRKQVTIDTGGGVGVGGGGSAIVTAPIIHQQATPGLFATPKNSFKNKFAMTTTTGNTTGKRRPALCDVTLNTANRAAMGITPNHKTIGMGITPKFERSHVARALVGVCDYSKPNERAKRITDATSKVSQLAVDDECEPIERFIGSKYDSFDDIFPDGRLSEMYLGKKVTFVPKLPCGNKIAQSCEDLVVFEEGISLSPIHEFGIKACRNESLVELELPPLDDDDDTNGSLLDLINNLSL